MLSCLLQRPLFQFVNVGHLKNPIRPQLCSICSSDLRICTICIICLLANIQSSSFSGLPRQMLFRPRLTGPRKRWASETISIWSRWWWWWWWWPWWWWWWCQCQVDEAERVLRQGMVIMQSARQVREDLWFGSWSWWSWSWRWIWWSRSWWSS